MKDWTKPKLIILYRGRAEERVLGPCKDGIAFTGPDGTFQNECTEPHVDPQSECQNCSGRSAS